MSSGPAFWLRRLLNMGITAEAPFVDAQKNYMFNLFLLIATPFAAISFGINIAIREYLPAFFNVIQLLVFMTGFRISFTQKGLELRSLLVLVLFIVASLAAYYYKNGSEYRLPVMMVAAIILFDKNWQYIVFAVIAAVVFVLLRLHDMPTDTMTGLEITGYVLKIFVPLMLFTLALYYFKNIYFKNLEQLEKTNKRLLLAQEQKERILNTVAHDLRSPISNISGISKMMLTHELPEEKKTNFLKLVEHSAHSALSLINNLLQQGDDGTQALPILQTDVNAVLKEWVPSLQFGANEKKIRIQLNCLDKPAMILMNCDRMERVFTNLVNNAIKFSPEHSVITIKVTQQDGFVVVRVSDEGIGIPKEKLTQVFEMFTDAKRTGTAGEKGFGMGLSISKQIIEQHHGLISVESEEGKGTTFMVKLPLLV